MRGLVLAAGLLTACSGEIGGSSAPGDSGVLGRDSTAGAPDGAASADGPGGGADGGSSDPCAGTLLCDDFEAYSLGGAPGGSWLTSTRLPSRRCGVLRGTAHSERNPAASFTARSARILRSSSTPAFFIPLMNWL